MSEIVGRTLTINQGSALIDGEFCRRTSCLVKLAQKMLIKQLNKRLALISVLIAGSTILSLSSHFPSIMMAWATDPFYASGIALFYTFNIGAYFTFFHYVHIFSSRIFGKIEGHDVIFTKKTWFFCSTISALFLPFRYWN